MVSEDFLKLTNMIYIEHWTPVDYTLKWSKESGYDARIVLERDKVRQELVSSADDFAMLVFDLKQVADSKGQIKLRKIRKAEKYYSDIEYLLDEKGEKLKAAAQTVLSDSFQFQFDPFEGIRKILQDRIPTNDPDVRGVKEHYYETLVHTHAVGRGFAEWKHKEEKINAKLASYAAVFEKILREAFMRPGKKQEPVQDYRKFLDWARRDVADLGWRILEQQKYTDFLMGLLVKAGGVDVENGVRAVLDVYWRMCELCYPLLNVTRIAIEVSQGKDPNLVQPSFEDLVKSLAGHAEATKLLDCVEPVLRNCEAHAATGVVLEGQTPIVVAYETRTAYAREIARMPFSQVDEKAKCLKYSLVPALYNTLLLFEYAFQVIVLNSHEFKLLLVTLDQF
jgi:hypothetical protein